ncbi:hypothetical protein JCM6882_004957 [Rhodosporidiobolus microsporus]
MPVPPLPLEVVTLIVDEVRLSCAKQRHRRVAGLTIALVCRAWRSLGEGVCWHHLPLLDADVVRETVRRFEEAPHLARSVRKFSCGEPVLEDEEAEAAITEDLAATKNLLAIWRCCTRVEVLGLYNAHWVNTSHFFSHLSPSDSVQTFNFETHRPHGATHLLRALTSFPRLSTLSIIFPKYSASADSVETLRAAPLVPLRHFDCVTTSQFPVQAAPSRPLLRELIEQIHPDTLQTVTLVHNFADLSLLDHLFRFPDLRTLTLTVLGESPWVVVDRVLELSERRQPPLSCSIGSRTLEGFGPAIRLRGKHTLEEMLAALAPCLYRFALVGMHIEAPTLPPTPPAAATATPPCSLFAVGVKLEGQEEAETVLFGRSEGPSQWYTLPQFGQAK